MTQIRVKTAKVNNPKNVLVQLPKIVVELLELNKDDLLDVYISADTKTVTIKKKDPNEPDTE